MNEWLDTCETAARAGGRELLAWRGRFQTREKAAADLVTDADLASQQAIQSVVAARFPNHAFLGEEQTTKLQTRSADQFTWIVDPLDGTTNYVHGYPNYAVSVALARGTEILAGVIYNPLSDECYTAAAGHGAWLDGSKLQTSTTQSLAEALLGISLPARVAGNSPDLLDFVEIVQVCQAVRRTGSAALNLAHVATGVLDAFWATHIQPWDVAAGVLLIREAGGTVTGRNGADFDLWNPHFLSAGNRTLHRRVLEKLAPYRPS
jgi:myo-inositol-1(or 4)-monophosphatase